MYCCSAQEFLPSNVTAERSSILHTKYVRASIARPEWGLQMLKSKQRTLLSCAISSVLGLGVGATALAQETSRTSVLEEVIVTAEKRAVDIQDVPVAVSAYTSETRTLLGVNTVEDLARFTPSVAYRNDDRLAIRGVGRLTNAVGTDPAVALYSDGIFSTSMADTSTPPLFIERTEILRGPQGTLYGRNSVGGAINVISKRPTDKFEGEVRLQGGNYSFYHADGSGPRPDHRQPALPVRRVQGEARRRLHQESSVRPRTAPPAIAGWSRGRSKWISARTPWPACATRSSNGTTRTAWATRCCRASRRSTRRRLTPAACTTTRRSATRARIRRSTIRTRSNTNRTVVGTLEDHQRIHLDFTWDLGGATLKYFGGYQEYLYHTGADSDETAQTAPIDIAVPERAKPLRSVRRSDHDGRVRRRGRDAFTFDRPATWRRTSRPIARAGTRSTSAGGRTRSTSRRTAKAPLQWIVGLYQYNTTWDNPQHTTAHGDTSLLIPADGSRANPDGWNGSINGHLEGDSYAGFGQIDWASPTKWTFTLGARYTEDKKEGFDEAWYVGRIPALLSAPPKRASRMCSARRWRRIRRWRLSLGSPQRLTPSFTASWSTIRPRRRR